MPRGRGRKTGWFAKTGGPRIKSQACEIDGHRFPSKREAKRYCELKLMAAAGLIQGLELQPRFALRAGTGETVGHYVADFRYLERTNDGWQVIVEDVKGFKTEMYKWKKRHMKAEYHIEIRET